MILFISTGPGICYYSIYRKYFNPTMSFLQGDPGILNRIMADSLHTRLNFPFLSYGAGLLFAVDPLIKIGVIANFKATNYDLIDGFSNSANPSNKDHFYNIGFTIQRTGTLSKSSRLELKRVRCY